MNLRAMTLLGKWQFSRYTMIGASAAAAYVVIATVLGSFFSLDLWVSSAVAYVTCIPFAYLGQKKLAFKSDRPHSFAFPRYCGVQITNTIVSSALSAVFSRIPDLPAFVVFAVSGAMVVGANYVFLSRWAFRPQ
ncbi:GtrA family protein [Microvirga sp. 2MCAF38]|uniref:GtrA family protein n=1 Tax=Microvirga sp. 2MCAF38 TaxID=3232989 RepID=UPI003F960EBB